MGKAINQAKEIAAEIKETEQAAAAAGTATEEALEAMAAELPAATLDELEGLDMEAFARQEQPEGTRQWRIADDALLSGTLKLKIGGVAMKQDDGKLLEYLKASGNTDMIKVTESPKWGDFKKRLEIVGGVVVDQTTGEIVEGVEVIEKPDTFSVDV